MKRIIPLVVLFVVFYVFFSRAPLSEEQRGFFGSGLGYGLLGLVFLVVFGITYSRTRGWQTAYNEGAALTQQGRTSEVLEKFKVADRKSSWSITSMTLGATSLLLWKVPDAIAAFQEFERRTGRILTPTPEALKQSAYSNLSLAYALSGQLSAAHATLARVAPPSEISRLAEVALACREQQWQRAKELLAKNAMLLDQLGGSLRGLLDALIAWTASHLGGPGSEVSSVRLFRETSPDGLRQAWPELVAFVERVEAGPNSSALAL